MGNFKNAGKKVAARVNNYTQTARAMYYRIAVKTGELHLLNLNQACRIIRANNTIQVMFNNKAANNVVFTYTTQAAATREFNKLTAWIAPSLIEKNK